MKGPGLLAGPFVTSACQPATRSRSRSLSAAWISV